MVRVSRDGSHGRTGRAGESLHRFLTVPVFYPRRSRPA